MTDKITKAAEIIQHEVRKNVGAHIHLEDAERLAKQLHKLWSERVEIASLPPGEVAQRLRERYEEQEDDNPFHPESPEGRAWDDGDRSSVSSIEDLPIPNRASHYS